jgi:hypothetical protein
MRFHCDDERAGHQVTRLMNLDNNMTAEERTDKLLQDIEALCRFKLPEEHRQEVWRLAIVQLVESTIEGHNLVAAAMQEELEDAVAVEREECAKVAEAACKNHEPYSRLWGDRIASAIRAR